MNIVPCRDPRKGQGYSWTLQHVSHHPCQSSRPQNHYPSIMTCWLDPCYVTNKELHCLGPNDNPSIHGCCLPWSPALYHQMSMPSQASLWSVAYPVTTYPEVYRYLICSWHSIWISSSSFYTHIAYCHTLSTSTLHSLFLWSLTLPSCLSFPNVLSSPKPPKAISQSKIHQEDHHPTIFYHLMSDCLRKKSKHNVVGIRFGDVML